MSGRRHAGCSDLSFTAGNMDNESKTDSATSAKPMPIGCIHIKVVDPIRSIIASRILVLTSYPPAREWVMAVRLSSGFWSEHL